MSSTMRWLLDVTLAGNRGEKKELSSIDDLAASAPHSRPMESPYCPLLKSVALTTPMYKQNTHAHTDTYLHQSSLTMRSSTSEHSFSTHLNFTLRLESIGEKRPQVLILLDLLPLSFFPSLTLSHSVAVAKKERRNEDVIGMQSSPLSLSGDSDSLTFLLFFSSPPKQFA